MAIQSRANGRVSGVKPEGAPRKLSKTPTVKNVYGRKTLLRLLDASRLKSGLVTAAELLRENSPFAAMNFRIARISFRPRVRT